MCLLDCTWAQVTVREPGPWGREEREGGGGGGGGGEKERERGRIIMYMYTTVL